VSLNSYEERVSKWMARNVPDAGLNEYGLQLAEETGEVVRPILKMSQGIRGTREQWMAELGKEVGDVFFALQGVCIHAGIDLDEAVAARWEQVADLDLTMERMPDGRW
jgi:NTP pyrophosphatase (non-canonical NTP hydrolase)